MLRNPARLPALALLAALAFPTASAAAVPAAVSASPGMDLPAAGSSAPDTLAAQVDALFQRWHRPDSPGAAVLVMQDGVPVLLRGYGMANLEQGVPIRPSSVFDVASVSKQFGAFALALAEADGLVALDAPVHRYLPELPDFGHEVTLRQLVHHTAGVRDWPGTLSMGGWDYQDVMSFEQILRMAGHQRELNFPPGSEYAYSNTGYNLMAAVVERVSGQSFRAFTEERIFGPLGMHRTHFHDDHAEVVPQRADSYRPGPDGAWRNVVNSLTALGSSSLHTTVEDLARWIAVFEAAHHGEPLAVGSPKVFRRMHERGVLTSGDTIPYAWGQSLTAFRGVERWSHTGSWAGYRTVLHRFPAERFAVVVLANTADMNPSQLADRIVELYLVDRLAPRAVAVSGNAGGAGAEEGENPIPWTPDTAELEGYAGEYWSAELLTGYRLEVRDGMLVASHFRTGDRPFRPAGAPDRFLAPTFGEVHFLRDEAGEVTGFTANQQRIRGLRFERVR